MKLLMASCNYCNICDAADEVILTPDFRSFLHFLTAALTIEILLQPRNPDCYCLLGLLDRCSQKLFFHNYSTFHPPIEYTSRRNLTPKTGFIWSICNPFFNHRIMGKISLTCLFSTRWRCWLFMLAYIFIVH